MIFAEENKPKKIETKNPTWQYIESSLDKLEPFTKSYFILTNKLNSFVQCAGSKERLCVEYRKFEGQTFKHFVIGKKRIINSTIDLWTQIECNVGPIRILDTEVLTLMEAKNIFKLFYESQDFTTIYNNRNITKLFEIQNTIKL